ncbi:hypothetical protein AJ87_14540 [Rhizobium yanglingense]|nr:hypothetical protein AJ87_14540 [Rhizobium yanglingense]
MRCARQSFRLVRSFAQLEHHAQNVERIQLDAIFEIGRELATAQELFKYRRDEGEFTGWLGTRLPQIQVRSAYKAIQIWQGIDADLLAILANKSEAGLLEVAKAEPDIQALIARPSRPGNLHCRKGQELTVEAAAAKAELKHGE